MDHYERNAYLSPCWEGLRVENESLFVLADADGTVPAVDLLYPIDRIEEVRSSDLSVLYKEGVDYAVLDGKFAVLPGGSIPVTAHNEFFMEEKPADGGAFRCTLGGFIFFGEKSAMHTRQISITYTHRELWDGYVPESKARLLPRTHTLLEEQKPLRVLVYGDSISTGVNSTGRIEVPPFAEDWPHMVVGALSDRYGAKIDLVNTAVGGTGIKWGIENAKALACDHHPDLCIIGFGMNDGGTEPEEEANRIAELCDLIRKDNPKCEFLLLSTMLPHRIVTGFYGKQEGHLAYLLSHEQRGVAVCNITSMHASYLRRKRYFDMSGNNVNHPNDFLARMYAQTILATIG